MEQEATTPFLILQVPKKIANSFQLPSHRDIMPSDIISGITDLHSSPQRTTELSQILYHTCQCCLDFPDTPLHLTWEQTPMPRQLVQTQSFALTHTGNPQQAQKLDPVRLSVIP